MGNESNAQLHRLTMGGARAVDLVFSSGWDGERLVRISFTAPVAVHPKFLVPLLLPHVNFGDGLPPHPLIWRLKTAIPQLGTCQVYLIATSGIAVRSCLPGL